VAGVSFPLTTSEMLTETGLSLEHTVCALCLTLDGEAEMTRSKDHPCSLA